MDTEASILAMIDRKEESSLKNSITDEEEKMLILGKEEVVELKMSTYRAAD